MWKQGWPTCCLTRCTAPDVHKIVSRHQHSAQCTSSTEHSAQWATTSQCTAHKAEEQWQKWAPCQMIFCLCCRTRGARASVLDKGGKRNISSKFTASTLYSVSFQVLLSFMISAFWKHSAERWLLQGAWGRLRQNTCGEAKCLQRLFLVQHYLSPPVPH